MVVHDLHFACVSSEAIKPETDAILLVDADGPLAFPISPKSLQSVARRNSQFLDVSRDVYRNELRQRLLPDLRRDRPGSAALEQLLRFLVRETPYHEVILAQNANNDKSQRDALPDAPTSPPRA